jgi:pimeloyl-ACP methyl ester carboxylesterase
MPIELSNSFTEHQATLPGGPMHYRKAGSGRPLLYIHGTGGPNHTPVLEHHATKHTVYQPTAPGWDGTPLHSSVKTMKDLADVYADFIRTVIGEKCDVIGNSFGGWIAQWLAVRHGDLVDHLVLQVSAGMRDPGTGGLPHDPVELRRQLYRHPERAPGQTRDPAIYNANRALRDKIAAGLAHDKELEALLPTIKARTLIVFGLNDEISPYDKAGPRLKRGIPQSHLTYIYDAAHSIEFDQPERVARLVSSFLERGEGFLVRRGDEAA